MSLLSLDLGERIGWVLGGAVGPIRHGVFQLEKTTDLGRFLRSSDEFFQTMMPLASAVACEQPFLGQSYYPARKLLALLGHAYFHGHLAGLGSSAFTEIPVATGKLNLAGKGNATKEEMIAAALDRYGLEMEEHDADALGLHDVWHFGRRERAPARRTRSSKPVVIKP